MHETIKELEALEAVIKDAMKRLDIARDQAKLKELEVQSADPSFWDDPARAAKVSQELAGLKKHVDDWQDLLRDTQETLELANLNDATLTGDVSDALSRLKQEFGEREFELKLSGTYDRSSAIVSIYAGTGGTDAQDWTQMLLRMYLRHAEQAGYATVILDQSDGEEAGIKSVTMEVNGSYAYGKLKGEKGVHRLVRLSPFNSDNLRQTSFAMVDVLPQLETPEQVEIDPKDLRIDVYRSGGHGGQSVNTTDSAVRITHLPTGIVVAIQNERSQLQNKEKAMALLKSRLALLMAEQHKAKVSELKGAVQSAEWGSQIRSYVLHPYTKVKDHRTNAETSAVQEVLDGKLDQFIEAYLQSQIGQ